MAGALSSSLLPPGETTRSARAEWGPGEGRQTDGQGGYCFQVEESSGRLSTEMHYFSPFFVKNLL